MPKPHWRSLGTEPDYRFSLANERTFLAWIRTALALLAGGVLLGQFANKLEPHAPILALSVGLSVLSCVQCPVAYLRWKHNEIAMRHGRPLPGGVAMPLLAAATMALSAIIGGLFLLR